MGTYRMLLGVAFLGGTKIYDAQSNDILFYLDGVDASNLDVDDFLVIDFV